MFEAMALEIKVNEALQIVDKNTQYLAEQLDKSNAHIAELEKRVVELEYCINGIKECVNKFDDLSMMLKYIKGVSK